MNSSKRRILCVDDSQDTGEMFAAMLTLQGHEVQISTTVAEAKRLIKLKASDLYILDMGFPDGEGAELSRWIRTNDPESTVLIYTIGCGYRARRCTECRRSRFFQQTPN